MISKQTQGKLLAHRILSVTLEPVNEEGFCHVGIGFFAILALVNFLFWS